MINQNHMIRNRYRYPFEVYPFICSYFNFIISVIQQYNLFYFYKIVYYNPSMKNKKIIYVNEFNPDEKYNMRKQSSSKNKNLSSGKALRQMSINKNRNGNQTNRSATGLQKVSSSQKIKIFLTKDGFIFEKKYLIYEIQCTLTKKQKQVVSTSRIKTNTNIQIDQSFNASDQDTLLLNLESSSFGITKALVRHNFPIERDNLNFIQVRVMGYCVNNIVITNKKIQFLQPQNGDCIDQQQITLIQPIKSIQLSQCIRLQKINKCIQGVSLMKSQGFIPNKCLNFCWNLQQKIQILQNFSRHHHKRSDLQNLSTNNSYTINQTTTNRQSSKVKRMNSLVCQSNVFYRQNFQKANLNQLVKQTKQISKVKGVQKKVLNQSGTTQSGVSKNDGKQNKRQDAYGLEQINKKSRNKTKIIQNSQFTKKIFVESLEEQQRLIKQENKYVYGKKIS